MDKQAVTDGRLYNEIKTLINTQTQQIGKDYVCGKFEGEGWLPFHYVCSTFDGMYPRISLKQQKNAVHFYIMLWIDGVPVLERYTELFGKSAVGKGCLRIKQLTPERARALCEIIELAKAA